MPQIFNVLNCSGCGTFQVHPVVKAKKWSCKICGVKQSFLKVFGEGTGAECRQHVQKLNMARAQKSSLDVAMAAWAQDQTDTDESIPDSSPVLRHADKWNQYIEENDEELEGDSSDPESYTPDFRTFAEKHVITRHEPATKHRKLECVPNAPVQKLAPMVTSCNVALTFSKKKASFTKTVSSTDERGTSLDVNCHSLEGMTDFEKCLLSGADFDEPFEGERTETETETVRDLKTAAYEQCEPSVTYEQRQPSVTYEQCEPSVTYEQRRPSVTYEQRRPSVTYGQRQPSVTYGQRQPSVTYGQRQLSVSYGQRQPSVTYERRQPSVSYDQRQPSVSYDQRQPSVTYGQRQPSVTYEQRQPSVTYEQRQPSVTYGQRQPSTETSSKLEIERKDCQTDSSASASKWSRYVEAKLTDDESTDEDNDDEFSTNVNSEYNSQTE